MADGKAKMITLAAAENPGAEALIAALAEDVASIPETAPRTDTFAGTAATEQSSHALNEGEWDRTGDQHEIRRLREVGLDVSGCAEHGEPFGSRPNFEIEVMNVAPANTS